MDRDASESGKLAPACYSGIATEMGGNRPTVSWIHLNMQSAANWHCDRTGMAVLVAEPESEVGVSHWHRTISGLFGEVPGAENDRPSIAPPSSSIESHSALSIASNRTSYFQYDASAPDPLVPEYSIARATPVARQTMDGLHARASGKPSFS